MYCSKCGIRLPDSANYCMRCGVRVDLLMQPNSMIEYYRSVIDFSYLKIKEFNTLTFAKDKFFKVFDYDGCRVLDFHCIQQFSESYEDIEYFADEETDYYIVKRGTKYALRNKTRLLTEFVFDEISHYYNGVIEGYAFVKKRSKYGIIHNKTGKLVFDCTYDRLDLCHMSWPRDYRWASKNGQWGVLSIKKGTVIKPFIYNSENDIYNIKF